MCGADKALAGANKGYKKTTEKVVFLYWRALGEVSLCDGLRR